MAIFEPRLAPPSALRHPPRLGDRSWFPALEASAYLNHAGISPPSSAVGAAVADLLARYARVGSGGFGEALALRDGLRQKLAELLDAAPGTVALRPGTTAGVIDVAFSLPWRARDRVVLFHGEFPANVTPWQRAAEHFDLELVWLPLDDYRSGDGPGLDRLRDTLRGGARLIAVSAVQFQTGLSMPLADMAELAHARGAELFVDAVQALGSLPLSVRELDIDYLVAGSHKWLMGPEGTGVLYVKPEPRAAMVPRLAGWLGHESAFDFLVLGPGHLRYDRKLLDDAGAFEVGTSSTLAQAGLAAALEPILALGPARIFAHVNQYFDALEPALVERGFRSLRRRDAAGRSCLLCAGLPAGVDGPALVAALRQRGVIAALPDGQLRFSPHWPNALAEVPGVVAALDDALDEVRARG